jgi:hypothetical protein
MPVIHVKQIDFGLPDTQQAFLEARASRYPRERARWSHAAVYYAGAATGWFELTNKAEADVFPVFANHYAEMCRRVTAGESLAAPDQSIHARTPQFLTRAQNKARCQQLLKELDQ